MEKVFFQGIVAICGVLTIAIAFSPRGRDLKTRLIYIVVGFGLLFIAQGIKDPPNLGFTIVITPEMVVTWIGLVLGLVSVIKSIAWAISKTELYQKFVRSLDAVSSIENMYRQSHPEKKNKE